MILWILKLDELEDEIISYGCINLILWILKLLVNIRPLFRNFLYKFDPMDFETNPKYKIIFLSWKYKFDPMDFETKI